MGITINNCATLLPKSFFPTATIAQAKLQHQLMGVMLSTKSSPSDCRFSSLGLNLGFEGMLLAVSLRHHVKGTDSEPRELGPKHVKQIHDAFVHLKGALLHFL
jgi:hypothetical protein